MVTKIVFVGKPEMGKTTIKKVVFEGVDPNKLALFPLEATVGLSRSVYEFMDSKISLLDTPGQSLPVLLKDEERQINYFENASVITYIFDFPSWIENSQSVIDDIVSIYNIKKKLKINAKIILFFHKVDLLIDKKIGTRLDIIKRHVNKQLNLPEELPLYFTSLHPNLIYTIYNALSDIFSNFSEDSSNLKQIITKLIKGLSKTICFVSNQEDYLIIQVPTKDFDTSTLYHLYERIALSTKLSEETVSKSKYVTAGSKILVMEFENIENYHKNFKNIFVFSETLETEGLVKLLNDIKEELNQYYN
ncbi:hypothetical protein LCGC14_0965130 [marine sediment metagenome]|uniref:G domain-containing protein n=1 Tax=marine sediment metagenome TaxID=412755 RepID=A0A0F9NDE6_9ZZZZ